MDIYLIRHGQSHGNGRGRYLGWSEHALTELGYAQAEAVAARLAPLGPMPVICSDLRRTCLTAEIIAARWGGTFQTDSRWREIHCGALEDCPWDDLRRFPEIAANFDIEPYTTPMPDGESLAMMAARVVAAFRELLDGGAEQVVVVTHDGPIRAVLAHCLEFPPTRFWTLATDHGGLTRVSYRNAWLSVRAINDTGHLTAAQLTNP